MCGRFTLTTPPEVLREVFGLTELPPFGPRYNIAPTQDTLLVRYDRAEGRRVAERARFGLLPPGTHDPRMGAKLINARVESVFDRPSFRDAARFRRALIPTDGFFEWTKTPRGKMPQWIRLASGRPFGMAAVFERATDLDGTPSESFAVLTTAANDRVRPIHDRMPVIIAEPDFSLWLDPEIHARDPLARLFSPFPAEGLILRPVSRRVNMVANDDPSCVAPPEPTSEDDPPRGGQLGFDFER